VIRASMHLDGADVAVTRYSGLSDMAHDFETRTGPHYPEALEVEGAWWGASAPVAIQCARGGDASRVPASDALLARMEELTKDGAKAWATVSAPVGGTVNVPEYLAGNPMNMRLRRRQLSQAAPLAVIVNLGTEAPCGPHQIELRGVAALALVRALSAVRPVTLVLMAGHSEKGDTLNLVEMDTAPLDLARAAWALCAPEVLRRFLFAASAANWPQGSYGFTPLRGSKRGRHDLAAQVMGFEEFIAIPRLTEGDFKTDGAAFDWLKEHIAKGLPTA
jgi:hypothetical protein